jgi:hypothetical protein
VLLPIDVHGLETAPPTRDAFAEIRCHREKTMKTSLVWFAIGIWGLVLGLGQVEAQFSKTLDLKARVQYTDRGGHLPYQTELAKTVPTPRDRALIPKTYLSIPLVYARREANSTNDLVTIFVHNTSRKTVTNVSYTIHNNDLQDGRFYKLHASGYINIKLGGRDKSPSGEVPPGVHHTEIMIRGDNYSKYILNLSPSIEGPIVFSATRDATSSVRNKQLPTKPALPRK